MSLIGILGASAASATLYAIPVANWPAYSNVRYGYQIYYPSELLQPQREADNGDGQRFLGPNGAEMLVFGQFNSSKSSLTKWSEGQAKVYMGKRGRIIYRAVRRNWAVFSGNDGGGFEFYIRSIEKAGRFVTFQIKYPTRDSKIFRPVVGELAHCMRTSPLPD